MVELRQESTSLDYYSEHVNKLDLVLLGQLRVMCSSGNKTTSKKKKNVDRTRIRTNFMLKGYQVCKTTFPISNNISNIRFKRLMKVYNNEGVVPKLHGNTTRSPAKTLSLDAVTLVVTFIKNYTIQNAIFLPGRQSTQFNISVKLLPTSESKINIHFKYKNSCTKDITPVSLRSFYKIWQHFCQDIVIQSLCLIYVKYVNKTLLHLVNYHFLLKNKKLIKQTKCHHI